MFEWYILQIQGTICILYIYITITVALSPQMHQGIVGQCGREISPDD
jgi:hypothetical protein